MAEEILVVVPFADEGTAQAFVALSGGAITRGRMYEYLVEDTQERYQIVEIYPEGHWEAFTGPDSDEHHVLQRRIYTEVSDGAIDDHDGAGPGS